MKLLLASAHNYGKVHNVLCCYADIFLTFMASQKSKDDLWIFWKAELSAVKKNERNII